jgi:hypothetical protein
MDSLMNELRRVEQEVVERERLLVEQEARFATLKGQNKDFDHQTQAVLSIMRTHLRLRDQERQRLLVLSRR